MLKFPRMSGTTTVALRFSAVTKRYPGAKSDAVQNINVDIGRGEQVALVGRSGSGKSTFLHLAAGIDVPSSGHIVVAQHNTSELTERERSMLRRDHVGLIFQFFHLLPHLSVIENVLLPAMIAGETRRFRPRAIELLERVALADRADDSAEKLSGGEMQRIAICRSLLRQPKLLLADEPTGNLDDETGASVMALLTSVVREQDATLVMVTHSPELASVADRVLEMHDGRLAQRPPLSEVGAG